jgi:hypothetical protein
VNRIVRQDFATVTITDPVPSVGARLTEFQFA